MTRRTTVILWGLTAALVVSGGLAEQPSPSARPSDDAHVRQLDSLAWMVGSWLKRKPGVETEEHWIAAKGDMMLGMNRTVRESGRTSFEFLRIARTPTGISYFASPSGRPATEFKIVDTAEKEYKCWQASM